MINSYGKTYVKKAGETITPIVNIAAKSGGL